MVDIDLAREIAKGFVKKHGEILPGIFYSISEAKEYSDCFYFNFLLVDKNGQLPSESSMVGGAPGFIIHKASGIPEIISFGKLASLS